MNVNPFSYLIEKLKGKVDKSGDTMSGRLEVKISYDNTPLLLKGNDANTTWIRFDNTSDNVLGYLGVQKVGANDPRAVVFYGGQAHGLMYDHDLKTTTHNFYLDNETWALEGEKYYIPSAYAYEVSDAETILGVTANSNWGNINGDAILMPYINGKKISLMSNRNTFLSGATLGVTIFYV